MIPTKRLFAKTKFKCYIPLLIIYYKLKVIFDANSYEILCFSKSRMRWSYDIFIEFMERSLHDLEVSNRIIPLILYFQPIIIVNRLMISSNELEVLPKSIKFSPEGII